MKKVFKTKSKIRKELILKLIILSILFLIILKLCFSLIVNCNDYMYIYSNNKISYYKDTFLSINTPERLLKFYEPKEIDKDNYIKASYILNNKPLIYIYNTHQKESYSDKKTVYNASYYFKDKMNKLNIDVIVEDGDITEFMRINNMSYGYSYYASKFFIQDALKKHNFDLIIDLHRDAASKNSTTVKIKNKSYAKILFVVGKEHKNYKVNYSLAESINKKIATKYPTLTKGIMLKSGKNVNGIYNQNLNSNMVLIEIGGNYNNFDEVKNTIDLISNIIGDYLYEKR